MKKSLLSLLTIATLALAPACCWDRCDKPCNPRQTCLKKQGCPKPCKPKCRKKRCKPYNECAKKTTKTTKKANGYTKSSRGKKSTRKVASRKKSTRKVAAKKTSRKTTRKKA